MTLYYRTVSWEIVCAFSLLKKLIYRLMKLSLLLQRDSEKKRDQAKVINARFGKRKLHLLLVGSTIAHDILYKLVPQGRVHFLCYTQSLRHSTNSVCKLLNQTAYFLSRNDFYWFDLRGTSHVKVGLLPVCDNIGSETLGLTSVLLVHTT